MSLDSRVGAQPLRILCQHAGGSCAACCGVHNFRDRSTEASHARLVRRTARVQAAWPNVEALRAVRDELLVLEAPDVLFATVKVCPFAGYVEPPGELPAELPDEPPAELREGRVGCLLHPSRHPAGADLRDLAVYPREVCAGHFCAPHDWLRPHEVDLAQTARGTFYGVVVTDAGLVKALARLLEERLARRLTPRDLAEVEEPLQALWETLRTWPFRDPNPLRFGAFTFSGDDASEHTLPSCLATLDVVCAPAEARVLDGLGSRFADAAAAHEALALLEARLEDVVAPLR